MQACEPAGSAQSREAAGSRVPGSSRPCCTSLGCCPHNVAEQWAPRKAVKWALSSLGSGETEEQAGVCRGLPHLEWSRAFEISSKPAGGGRDSVPRELRERARARAGQGRWHSAGLMTTALSPRAGRPSRGLQVVLLFGRGGGGRGHKDLQGLPLCRRRGMQRWGQPVHDTGHLWPLPAAHGSQEGAACWPGLPRRACRNRLCPARGSPGRTSLA